jgi:hypothetical protein
MTTYTQDLELKTLTALSLISTIHKSLHAKSSPGCSVFNSRSLATVSKSGDSSASRAQVPMCTQHNCQLTTNWVKDRVRVVL